MADGREPGQAKRSVYIQDGPQSCIVELAWPRKLSENVTRSVQKMLMHITFLGTFGYSTMNKIQLIKNYICYPFADRLPIAQYCTYDMPSHNSDARITLQHIFSGTHVSSDGLRAYINQENLQMGNFVHSVVMHEWNCVDPTEQ